MNTHMSESYIQVYSSKSLTFTAIPESGRAGWRRKADGEELEELIFTRHADPHGVWMPVELYRRDIQRIRERNRQYYLANVVLLRAKIDEERRRRRGARKHVALEFNHLAWPGAD